jgi:hypothetical protein
MASRKSNKKSGISVVFAVKVDVWLDKGKESPDDDIIKGILVHEDGTPAMRPEDGRPLCVGEGDGSPPVLMTGRVKAITPDMQGWTVTIDGGAKYKVDCGRVFH